jgi:GAF domain-containing protein
MSTQTVSDWNAEIQGSRAVFLNGLLLLAVIGGLVALILTYISFPESLSVPERLVEIGPFAAGWLIALIPWAWRNLGYRPRAVIMLLLTYLLSLFIFYRGGLYGSGRVWMLIFPALTFLLLGARPGIWAGIVSVLTYSFFAIVFSKGLLVPLIDTDDPSSLKLWIGEGASFLLMVAILVLILWSSSRSWLEAMARAVEANQQLQARTQELEETTEQLRRQASQLQTTAEIAHAGSSILDPERLFTEAVNRIQEGFSLLGVYYVGLFLLDDADADVGDQFAVLRAATGEAGRLLLEMNYELELAETSAVGWCIIRQQPHVALDIAENTVQLDALSMPNTRSEIALPLRSRGRVLGALSVHSTREAAFSEADIALLQTMADQVALAIDNARLFSQTEAALEEVQAAHQRYLRREWRELLDTKPVTRITYSRPGHGPAEVTAPAGMEAQENSPLHEARRQAMVSGQTVIADGFDPHSDAPDGDEATAPLHSLQSQDVVSQTALVVPLKLRGQVIGTIALHEARRQRPWVAAEIALAETVAEQTALTIETLRLMDETQRRAVREQRIGEIANRMQRATNMQTLMHIMAEELNQALGGARVYVRLGTESSLRPLEGDERAGRGDDGDAR